MEPKHIFLICSILIILISFAGFCFVNKSNIRRNVNTEKPIIVASAKGVYGDDVNNIENSNKIKDINTQSLNTESVNSNIGPAEQIRKMREDFPDKVVPQAGKDDKKKVIECVKKYLREEKRKKV